MKNFVIADFEATFGNMNGVSKIHSMCLIPVKYDNGKLTKQKGLVIFIRDVLKEDVVRLGSGLKLTNTLCDAAMTGMNIKVLDFSDAIREIITFIINNGSILVTHNLLNDLDFLISTQEYVGGKRMVKRNLKEYPKSGVYDKRWSQITLICSMCLITNRCTKFMDSYQRTDMPIDLTPAGYLPITLEALSQFVKGGGDTNYKQSHTATQDTIDLFEVLKVAFSKESRCVIDDTDYYVKPEWVRPIK
jgi:hypothetical protein